MHRKENNERIKHRANMDCDYIALHHVILARKKRIRLENRRIAHEYYVGICFCVSCSKDANISVISRYCSWMEAESLLECMGLQQYATKSIWPDMFAVYSAMVLSICCSRDIRRLDKTYIVERKNSAL